ncbi:MAG: LysR family hydrogen peroxide-inducible transcriptional activator [Sphingobacteriales bacterium]|jgi:LysR family hydrogen peroxide-inducible transcriptional activator
MNIQQFQYVLAVVDLKNFESAAERCFVTQSNLSTMIGRLEDEIGIKIFNRKTKPVSITPEGEQIIDRLRIVINEVESLENVIQELKGEMAGELKIGIIPTIAPYLLPLFLMEFASRFPKVNIIVKEMTTAHIQKAIKLRMLDIGILALPLGDVELDEIELYTEPFLVYDCRDEKSGSKISINNLDYSKLWLLQEGHCLRSQVYQICELSNQNPKSNINFEFESGSMGSLLRFTKSSKGITIIPYLASIDLPIEEKNNLVEFKEPIPVRSVGLLTHKFFVKKRLANELKKIIQDSVLELLPKIKETEIIKPV